MGLFDFVSDFIEDPIGTTFKLPGQVVEQGAEALVRVPEIPVAVVKGLVKGIETGANKVMDSLE